MIIAIVCAFLLVVLTTAIHYYVLKWLSVQVSGPLAVPEHRLFLNILALFCVHLLEIALYAFTYKLLALYFEVGSLGGEPVSSFMDYFYFSFVAYTSLGLGDIVPINHLRFMTGVEALNGLLLIAWSGSFIYIAMQRLWRWGDCPMCDEKTLPKN